MLLCAAWEATYGGRALASLRSEGIKIDGRVEAIERRGDSGHLRYSYTVADREYSGRAIAKADDLPQLRVGDAIAIRYVPVEPRMNIAEFLMTSGLADEHSSSIMWGSLGAAALFGLFGFLDLMGLRRQVSLARYGIMTTGRVVSAARARTNRLKVSYTFFTEAGIEVGGSVGVPAHRGESYWLAQAPRIIYDQTDPTKNTLVQGLWVKITQPA